MRVGVHVVRTEDCYWLSLTSITCVEVVFKVNAKSVVQYLFVAYVQGLHLKANYVTRICRTLSCGFARPCD